MSCCRSKMLRSPACAFLPVCYIGEHGFSMFRRWWAHISSCQGPVKIDAHLRTPTQVTIVCPRAGNGSSCLTVLPSTLHSCPTQWLPCCCPASTSVRWWAGPEAALANDRALWEYRGVTPFPSPHTRSGPRTSLEMLPSCAVQHCRPLLCVQMGVIEELSWLFGCFVEIGSYFVALAGLELTHAYMTYTWRSEVKGWIAGVSSLVRAHGSQVSNSDCQVSWQVFLCSEPFYRS